jgi:hypothetical protein
MVPKIAKNEARNGSAASNPNSNRLAPNPRANNVSGAPAVAVIHTEPNTHANVTSRIERRSLGPRTASLGGNFSERESSTESLAMV